MASFMNRVQDEMSKPQRLCKANNKGRYLGIFHTRREACSMPVPHSWVCRTTIGLDKASNFPPSPMKRRAALSFHRVMLARVGFGSGRADFSARTCVYSTYILSGGAHAGTVYTANDNLVISCSSRWLLCFSLCSSGAHNICATTIFRDVGTELVS